MNFHYKVYVKLKIDIWVTKLPFYQFSWVALIFMKKKNCGWICYITINFFAKFHWNLLKKFDVISYVSNWAFFGCSQSCICFGTCPLRIFEPFIQIFLTVNLSLNQTLLTFLLYVRQTWMTQSILTISLWGVTSSLNPKGF